MVTREQRLAGIAERAKKLYLAEWSDSLNDEMWNGGEMIRFATAFADSERERVLLEAAKAVCKYCRDDVNWHPAIITATAAYSPDWRHPRKTPDPMGSIGYALDCDAGPIHDLRSKGQL